MAIPGMSAGPVDAMHMPPENVFPSAPFQAIPGLPMALNIAGMMPPPPGPSNSGIAMVLQQAIKQSQPLPRPSPSTLSSGSKAPEREEVEEADDPSQWPVRIGSDPPPAWGKRRAEDEADEEDDAQKQSLSMCGFLARVYLTRLTLRSILSEDPGLPHALAEIARSSRFTQEEVQEFYDRSGNMDQTRERFRTMRETLARLFPLE